MRTINNEQQRQVQQQGQTCMFFLLFFCCSTNDIYWTCTRWELEWEAQKMAITTIHHFTRDDERGLVTFQASFFWLLLP